MSNPSLPESTCCAPDSCIDILRTFSQTDNGEATVQLMLRHIALKFGATNAAVFSLPAENGESRRLPSPL